jgi:hypothetical protein
MCFTTWKNLATNWQPTFQKSPKSVLLIQLTWWSCLNLYSMVSEFLDYTFYIKALREGNTTLITRINIVASKHFFNSLGLNMRLFYWIVPIIIFRFWRPTWKLRKIIYFIIYMFIEFSNIIMHITSHLMVTHQR